MIAGTVTTPAVSHQRADTRGRFGLHPARVVGADHRATMALAKAPITKDKADLWQARLAVKTLRRYQREAIAEAAED
jgi:hypothetical protein